MATAVRTMACAELVLQLLLLRFGNVRGGGGVRNGSCRKSRGRGSRSNAIALLTTSAT